MAGLKRTTYASALAGRALARRAAAAGAVRGYIPSFLLACCNVATARNQARDSKRYPASSIQGGRLAAGGGGHTHDECLVVVSV